MTNHALERSSCVLEYNNSIPLFSPLCHINVINAKRGRLKHIVVFEIFGKYSPSWQEKPPKAPLTY